jgi:predicted hydrocarbon binding protein
MKEIADRMGPHMLTRIGEQIANHGRLPKEIDTLLKFLDIMDAGYHVGHRGGEIGHYAHHHEGVVNGLYRSTIVASSPYPCAFDLGNLRGWTQKFRPDGATDVVVRHDDDHPCRAEGADSCKYLIAWG